MKKIAFLAILSAMLLINACSKKSETELSAPMIVTTTGLVGDLVQNIAGNSYQVNSLMGPGVDPHLYKASHGDIKKLSDADIIFYNGLHLEGKMTEILEKMGRSKNVVALSSGIDEKYFKPLEDAKDAHDPHLWFDVSLWLKTIPVIQNKLSEIFPQDKAVFEKNARLADSTLTNLHQWVKDEVAKVPQDRRIMITAHDAFGYFGKAYNIRVHGLQGISTVAEYGVNDVNRMVDLILEKKIRAVFVETSIPKRSIEAVVAGVNARNGNITIGGSLYSDAMGTAGSGAETYIGMVKTNVLTIVEALK